MVHECRTTIEDVYRMIITHPWWNCLPNVLKYAHMECTKTNPDQHGEFVTSLSYQDCDYYDHKNDGFDVVENVKSDGE